MKQRSIVAVVASAAAAFGLMAAFASSAMALPTYPMACSGCHMTNAGVTVMAAQTANDGTSATYQVTVSNNMMGMNNGWAVFSGSTKLAGAAGSTGSFSVPDGATYTVYAASANISAQYGNTLSISPVVPLDTTAPITTSNVKSDYLNSATVLLNATDNAAGSGVAHTYYILDSGTQTEGTTINTSDLGAHTLEFWSEDTSGNIEPHNNAVFNVYADTTAPVTTSNVLPTYVGSAAIRLTGTDEVGGSGVAHTYFILDGAAQALGTTINTSVVGTHTIEFWSDDVSNNVEAPHNTAAFTVNAAPVAPALFKYTYKFSLKKKVYKKLRAQLRNSRTGKKYLVNVSKKGVAAWGKYLPRGSYRLSTLGNLRFKFKARTVRIG